MESDIFVYINIISDTGMVSVELFTEAKGTIHKEYLCSSLQVCMHCACPVSHCFLKEVTNFSMSFYRLIKLFHVF